ncbi:MAG: UDP-N-acetylmuramoyl-L-alanine--D-glutamate ligase [Candidatus Omnitrophota bacterium]|nr:UDP-N-acetylmuramoyl-L-alanine--D-glutamate ligase [Candidatus Omnitrophota bacterium]
MTSLPGKKVTVLGLGQSGYESALFLRRQGFDVLVYDDASSEISRGRAGRLLREGICVELGGHSGGSIFGSDWILVSPGIKPAAPIYRDAVARKIPMLSEIEVAWRFCPSRDVIAITGTCGKTTVATLLHRALKTKFPGATLCGNIGDPWIGALEGIGVDQPVIVEVSSFQLQNCQELHPRVSVILNLSPNHLDWHADMGEYVQAKLKAFQNQVSGDHAVFRRRDQLEFFPEYPILAESICFGEDLRGNPNHEVVRTVAAIYGCDVDTVNRILDAFEGIEHRMERVAVVDGVTYVNDSKCTTLSSLEWAIDQMPDARVLLIAGGRPKAHDFVRLRNKIRQKAREIFVMGEAAPLLRDSWDGLCPVRVVNDLSTALESARSAARTGDTILLSPACASFDMFDSYQDRGRQFKEWVAQAGAPLSTQGDCVT